MLVVEVAPHDEGDLGFDFRLDELVARHVPAVRHRHVVEQHAIVGLIDAELALHGERSQTDLASDQPLPLLQPPLRVDLLRRIGEVDRVGGQHLPHRRNRRSRVMGGEQFVRHRSRGFKSQDASLLLICARPQAAVRRRISGAFALRARSAFIARSACVTMSAAPLAGAKAYTNLSGLMMATEPFFAPTLRTQATPSPDRSSTSASAELAAAAMPSAP